MFIIRDGCRYFTSPTLQVTEKNPLIMSVTQEEVTRLPDLFVGARPLLEKDPFFDKPSISRFLRNFCHYDNAAFRHYSKVSQIDPVQKKITLKNSELEEMLQDELLKEQPFKGKRKSSPLSFASSSPLASSINSLLSSPPLRPEVLSDDRRVQTFLARCLRNFDLNVWCSSDTHLRNAASVSYNAYNCVKVTHASLIVESLQSEDNSFLRPLESFSSVVSLLLEEAFTAICNVLRHRLILKNEILKSRNMSSVVRKILENFSPLDRSIIPASELTNLLNALENSDKEYISKVQQNALATHTRILSNLAEAHLKKRQIMDLSRDPSQSPCVLFSMEKVIDSNLIINPRGNPVHLLSPFMLLVRKKNQKLVLTIKQGV